MKGLLLLLCLLITPITQAGTYRWVDENGQTHFGDRPPANAASDEVELKAPAPSSDADARARKERMNEFLEQTEQERAEQRLLLNRVNWRRSHRAKRRKTSRKKQLRSLPR